MPVAAMEIKQRVLLPSAFRELGHFTQEDGDLILFRQDIRRLAGGGGAADRCHGDGDRQGGSIDLERGGGSHSTLYTDEWIGEVEEFIAEIPLRGLFGACHKERKSRADG